MKYSIQKQIKSFGYALVGISRFFSTQQNAKVQLVVACIVIAVAGLLQIKTWEWCLVILCIGAVFSLEAINTSIEKLCDTLHPRQSESIGMVKDIAAGAVLIISIIAVIIGLLIFVPYLINLAA